MKFVTKPWKHQLEALQYLVPRSFGALYTDMGSGKTKIMIDLIMNRDFEFTMIVCPKKVCRVWVKEFEIHSNKSAIILNLSNLSGTQKVTELKKHPNSSKRIPIVVIVNYESIWREPFKSYLLKSKIDCVICDESHRIKSPGSKCSRFLHLLGKKVPNRFLMTGTPLAQNPLDIYAQYRFLDQSIFGTNFGVFKEIYANWVSLPAGYKILDKRNPYKNLDDLHNKMFSCAFKTDSELDLPETQDITLEFDLSPEAEKHYKQLQKEGCLELEEGVVNASGVLTVITRLQQLTSGYLPTEEGKTIEVDTSRQDTLKELLEDIHEPVVIFAKYRKDITNIRRISSELNLQVSEISGKYDQLQDWLDEKTSVLVVQIASGAEGINLTRARYCIYYTLTHSLVQYKQSRKRVHRPGQTRPVIYYILVAKISKGNTIDERILQSLKNNQNVIDSIMQTHTL